jgi:hypothetical protein
VFVAINQLVFLRNLMLPHGGEAFDMADDKNMCLGMLLRNGSWGHKTVCRINELFMA